MSNGNLQQAGVANTKATGRLTSALEPMGGIYSDLESMERRMRSALDTLIGAEDEVATEKVPQPPTNYDSVDSSIRTMVHNYSGLVDRMQSQISRLEKV